MNIRITMLSAALGCTTLAFCQSYEIIDLGDLPGGSNDSFGSAINSLGHVAGSSGAVPTGNAGGRGFFWTPGGGMTDVGDLTGGINNSTGRGLNDLGQVVGQASGSAGPQAFIWDSTNGIVGLGLLSGGTFSRGNGINNSGLMVGQGNSSSGLRGFTWTSGGGFTTLSGLSGFTGTNAAAVNNAGLIVGSSTDSQFQAVYWNGGSAVGLGYLNVSDNFSEALGVSENGFIVGQSGDGSLRRGFVWSSGGGMTDIGDLAGGDDFSQAFDVNSAGVVVGLSHNAAGNRAVIWNSTNGLVELGSLVVNNPSGLTLQFASGINDAGQIVGYGVDGNGNFRGFVANPVPEPGTMVVLAGLGAIAARRRKRR